jgi:flavin reductase (DIM6/NTAB) family NADH-FMN oxidoreductase RutF
MIQIGLYDCILGEVLAMHCNAAVYHKKHPKGGVDHHQIQPILCLADEYWSGNSFLGVSTENKAHPHGSEH